MSPRKHITDVSVPVYLTVVFFAIATWIDINGIFVEVPLLVNILPEGWKLFSYMAMIIQVANISPIIYTILKKTCFKKIQEWPTVYIITGIGALACFMLAFLWQETTNINGQSHSTALFVLVAFIALVDCTSSVVYLPYMGRFKPQYLTAYYVGLGLGGMLPGLVGLVQGLSSEPECSNETMIVVNATSAEDTIKYVIVAKYPPPLFSVQVFFFFIFGMMIISGVSFTVLHFHPVCRREHRSSSCVYSVCDDIASKENNVSSEECLGKYRMREKDELQEKASHISKDLTSDSTFANSVPCVGSKDKSNPELTTSGFVYLLILIGLVNALQNGVIPSTQSYTCLPYGSLAFTLAVRLSTIVNPLLCLVALFFGTKSLAVIGSLSAIATGLTGWHLYLAAMSPYPPLKDTDAGTALVITTSVITAGCIAYVKVSSAIIFSKHGGSKSLLWCGVVTQIGSFVGALVAFICVNVLQLFESQPACPA